MADKHVKNGFYRHTKATASDGVTFADVPDDTSDWYEIKSLTFNSITAGTFTVKDSAGTSILGPYTFPADYGTHQDSWDRFMVTVGKGITVTFDGNGVHTIEMEIVLKHGTYS